MDNITNTDLMMMNHKYLYSCKYLKLFHKLIFNLVKNVNARKKRIQGLHLYR